MSLVFSVQAMYTIPFVPFLLLVSGDVVETPLEANLGRLLNYGYFRRLFALEFEP